MKDETKIVVTGRDPKAHAGAVNTPVYHASTIVYPSLAAIRGTEKFLTLMGGAARQQRRRCRMR